MHELVLYGIRLLAKQLLGTILHMEVDQSGSWGLFLLVEINNLAGVQSRDTSRTSLTGCQTHL